MKRQRQSSQLKNGKEPVWRYLRRAIYVIVIITLLFFLMGAIVWILQQLGLIHGPWIDKLFSLLPGLGSAVAVLLALYSIYQFLLSIIPSGTQSRIFSTTSGPKSQETASSSSSPPSQSAIMPGDSTEKNLPPSNIPFRRNPFFTDRIDIITRLHDTFISNVPVAPGQPNAIIIHGIGGIGKTQIAIQYAFHFYNEYKTILWIQAETQASLISSFTDIATLLGLIEEDTEEQGRITALVKDWMLSNTEWLLIIDNAINSGFLEQILPSARQILPLEKVQGHILLTTRAQAIGGVIKDIEIDNMGSEDAALFLLRRARIIDLNVRFDDIPIAQRTIAQEIAQALGYLPLALDQAGAYIEETGCDLSEYLHIYQTEHASLLSIRGEQSTNHPDSIATTLTLAFEIIKHSDPLAIDLLNLCAFLAPESISETIITLGCSKINGGLQILAKSPHLLNMAIRTLLKFSLIKRDSETHSVSVHRLVQVILRDEMDKINCSRLYAEHTIKAITQVFPVAEVSNWSQCQEYLPHALICANHINQLDIVTLEAADLLYRTGLYLNVRRSYIEAESLYLKAIAIYERLLGPDHPDALKNFSGLATVYVNQGKYEQAESLYLKAIAIYERALGTDHPDLASSLSGLANLYDNQGKEKEADALYQRVLQLMDAPSQ